MQTRFGFCSVGNTPCHKADLFQLCSNVRHFFCESGNNMVAESSMDDNRNLGERLDFSCFCASSDFSSSFL